MSQIWWGIICLVAITVAIFIFWRVIRHDMNQKAAAERRAAERRQRLIESPQYKQQREMELLKEKIKRAQDLVEAIVDRQAARKKFYEMSYTAGLVPDKQLKYHDDYIARLREALEKL